MLFYYFKADLSTLKAKANQCSNVAFLFVQFSRTFYRKRESVYVLAVNTADHTLVCTAVVLGCDQIKVLSSVRKQSSILRPGDLGTRI